MSAPGPSIPSSQASHLLSSFTSFLTVAIHSLLYHRNLYPPTSFLTARAYNLPVHQSRHPLVCAWIRDATHAIAAQLRTAAVKHIVLVVYGKEQEEGSGGGGLPVLERWVFDVHSFPAWGRKSDRHAFATLGEEDELERQQQQSEDQGRGEQDVNWTDVNEALRGALRRIAYTAESTPSLPDGCTFTLAVELRDEAEPPISHPQSWIPSQTEISPPSPSPRPGFIQNQNLSKKPSSSSTVPIRSVRAGPVFFECWVEQRDDDGDLLLQASTSARKLQPANTNDTDPSSSL